MKERKPNRLKGYDYSSDNIYFVTSCVQNRVCCFGNIVGTGRDPSRHSVEFASSVGKGRDLSLQQNGDLSLQQNGDLSIQMILNEWGTIAEKQWHWLCEQYPYVVLHAFVVMPNHIHGIIEINRSRIKSSDPIKIKSLSELIGAYKTTVSKQIHLLDRTDRSRPVPTQHGPVPSFRWQRSFHEHIIRDEKTFKTISDYILNNPARWEQDKFYNYEQ
ncbi:MAG: hypothetical protein A2V46_03255 [Bacteroidetes bacterium RBG_19FT_COMBO_42_7]|nr:MAG: hypothetical protein A2V46_03255 [Bacteroidetes bacterium RBG_19FT_COMBO_42_7]